MLLSLIGTTASGLLLALSFQRQASMHWRGWPSSRCFWAFERVSERVTATLLGWACGLALFCVDLIWIYGTLVNEGHFFIVPAAIAFFALAAYLALFFGGFGDRCRFSQREASSLQLPLLSLGSLASM